MPARASTPAPRPRRAPLRRLPAAALAAGLLLGACEGDRVSLLPVEDPSPGPISHPAGTRVVGFVGTLSGRHKWRGEDAFEGADLAVHHLNRGRARRSPHYDLRPLDDGGDARTATQLVEQLAELSATVAIVYAGPPEGLPPAEPALARAGIPAVLVYGDLLGTPRPHLFAMGPPSSVQARRIASYLSGDRRYRRVGALVERSPSGVRALAALRRAFRRTDARLVAARYRGVAGRLAGLERLRARRVEAVVAPGGPAEFNRMLRVLDRWGATYTTTAAARTVSRSGRRPPGPRRRWRPQPVGFDLAISPRTAGAPAGSVAPDSYLRGTHLLPLPPLRRFRKAFRAWWETRPTGWEQRAFDAVRAIGWAASRVEDGDDVAAVLEGLSGWRGTVTPVAFGPDDHVALDPSAVGLWVVPRRGAGVPDRVLAGGFPWAPLARSFIPRDGPPRIRRADRRLLVREPPASGDPPPPFARMRFAVTSARSDPVH